MNSEQLIADSKSKKARLRTMERWLGVVIYANWIAWLVWGALIFVVRWAQIDVYSLSFALKVLLIAPVVLTIALTVTNVILFNIIERRYEKEPE